MLKQTFNLIFFIVILITSQSCNDNCIDLICNNGGICNNGICDCPDGYLGINCEDIDKSKIQLLLDNGTTPFELLKNSNIELEDLYGKGYDEGLIFYLNPEDEVGMVAALMDQTHEEGVPWGCYDIDNSNVENVESSNLNYEEEGAKIGDGISNTNAILNGCNEDWSAARLCRNLGEEWYLPSLGEVKLMYSNLYFNGHGGFKDSWYWSSTESSGIFAWRKKFTNNAWGTEFKDELWHVRAAKTF